MVTGEQVTEVMSDYNMQLTEDAKDDADFQPSPNKVPLAALFVDMPEFDVNLLFDEVSAWWACYLDPVISDVKYTYTLVGVIKICEQHFTCWMVIMSSIIRIDMFFLFLFDLKADL